MNTARTCVLLVAILIISTISTNCRAQALNKKSYYAKLALTDGSYLTGILHSVGDSSVRLLKRDETIAIPVSNILFVKIRSKSAVKNGVLVGMGAGLFAGILITFESIDDMGGEFEGLSALGNMMLSTGLGAGVGILAGLIIAKNYKRKMHINGKLENFEKYKEKLQSYQIGPKN